MIIISLKSDLADKMSLAMGYLKRGMVQIEAGHNVQATRFLKAALLAFSEIREIILSDKGNEKI